MTTPIKGVTAADVPEVMRELTTVMAGGAEVCPKCHTWKSETERWCENCEEVASAIGSEPIPVSLVTLYAKPSNLRDWLTRYKGRQDGEDPWDPAAERIIRSLLNRFFQMHGAYIGGLTRADAVVVVPSTHRPPPHPLEHLLASIDTGRPIERLLLRTTEPIGFRQPNPDAYRAVLGRYQRVYLVDDVYTTGSHLNSAAQALRTAGVEVTGALVLARRVNPGYNAEAERHWERARAVPFSWDNGPYVQERK